MGLNATRLSLLGLSLMVAVSVAVTAQAKEITGKVVAVYHEKVTVNNKTMDKMSVTVADCAQGGRFVTAYYSPGYISQLNHYGHLYNQHAVAARSSETKTQYVNSVSGHVTLTVDDNNHISKTKYWGYNWECGRDLDGSAVSSAAPSQDNSQAAFQGTQPSSASSTPASATPRRQPPSAPPSQPGFGGLRRFGF